MLFGANIVSNFGEPIMEGGFITSAQLLSLGDLK